MSLIEHAKRELELSGVDEDIYGDMTSKAVLELIEVFSNQRHSGASAYLVTHLFNELSQYKNLTPLTDDPDEWVDHSDKSEDKIWQSKRNSEAFSNDEGKTYYLLSERQWVLDENGDPQSFSEGPLHPTAHREK